jgi:hypothetical protein
MEVMGVDSVFGCDLEDGGRGPTVGSDAGRPNTTTQLSFLPLSLYFTLTPSPSLKKLKYACLNK